jgi:uncharacterized protein (DUF433 family)
LPERSPEGGSRAALLVTGAALYVIVDVVTLREVEQSIVRLLPRIDCIGLAVRTEKLLPYSGVEAVRGTRVPVERVLQHLADNPSVNDVFAAFPHLTMDDAKACLAYAQDVVEQEGLIGLPDASCELRSTRLVPRREIPDR